MNGNLSSLRKKVLAGASNGFKSFKGEQVKEQSVDAIYASITTIQGTTDNQFIYFKTKKAIHVKQVDTSKRIVPFNSYQTFNEIAAFCGVGCDAVLR